MAMSDKNSLSSRNSINPLPDIPPTLRRSLTISDHNQDHMYACRLCSEKFATGQALGGHQSGHRRRRERAERLHQSQAPMMTQAQVIHDHQNPSNSASSNIFYSPNPTRVPPPLTEFPRVDFPPHHQPTLRVKRGPTFDGPSSAWPTHLLHRPPPPPLPPSPPSLPSAAAPPVAGYEPPPPPRRRLRPRPCLGVEAQLPGPVTRDFLAHGRAEHGSGSAAAMNVDNKGKAVVEEEEEEKKSWGRDLKLWY